MNYLVREILGENKLKISWFRAGGDCEYLEEGRWSYGLNYAPEKIKKIWCGEEWEFGIKVCSFSILTQKSKGPSSFN